MRLLWIDDDRYQTETLREIMEMLGYNIDFFTDYEKGVHELKTNPSRYEAIILDVMMPAGSLFSPEESQDGRITGLLLYKCIRKSFSGPLLIYTVFRDVALVREFIRNDDRVRYLEKPAHEDDIITKLNEMVH
jgi:ActR/RegA family two-component response regulator